MRNTSRGYVPETSNTLHTATTPKGEAFTCACARRSDHMVTQAELMHGSWKDTHPTLF
jgi:hypothetical protein